MGDELRADDVTHQSAEVRSHSVHSLVEVVVQGFSKVNQFNASLRKLFNLNAIGLRELLSHGNFGSINDLLSLFIIKNNVSELFFHIVIDVLSLFNEIDQLGENDVVIDDFSQLWEVPREPLFESHAKSVNVLVQLLNQSNGLNNWFVLPVDVSGALLSGVRVPKTQLGSSDVLFFDLLHDLDEVRSDSSLEFGDGLVERSGNAGFREDPIEKTQFNDKAKCLKGIWGWQGLSNLLLAHLGVNDAKQELLLLGALGGGEVSGQEAFERVCHLVVSDGSDVLESLLGGGEGLVGCQLDHL